MSNIKLGQVDEEGKSLSDVETVLNKVGIALRSSSTEFRDFQDVLDDVAGKWGAFNDIERASISNALAGTRQRENLLALFNNYGKALELEKTALDSNGLAQDRYNIQLEGTEAKLNKLKSTFEGLYTSITSSEAINFAVDGLTNLIQTLDNIIEQFGGFNIAIYATIMALTLVKGKAIVTAIQGLIEMQMALGATTVAEALLTGTTKALSAALMTLLTNPVTWLIVAIGTLSYALITLANNQQKLKEQTEAIKKTQIEFNKAIDDFYQSLDPSKISSTTDALNNFKKALEFDEASKKLGELQSRLDWFTKNPLLGTIISGGTVQYLDTLEILNKKISNYTDKINKGTEAEKLANQQKAISNVLDLDAQNTIARNTTLKLNQLEAEQQLVEQYKHSVEIGKEDKSIRDQLLEKYPQYLQMIGENSDVIGINTSALETNIEAQKTLAKASILTAQNKMRADLEETDSFLNNIDAKILAIEAEKKALRERQLLSKYMSDPDLMRQMSFEEYEYKQNNIMFRNPYSDYKSEELKNYQQKKEQLLEAKKIQEEFLKLNADDILKAYSNKTVGSNFIPGGGESTDVILDKQFQYLTKYKERIQDILSELNSLNKQVEDTSISLSLAEAQGDEQKQIDIQREIIDLLEQRKNKIHELAESIRANREEILDSFKSDFSDFTSGKDLLNLSEEDIANYKDSIASIVTDIENQMQYLNKDDKAGKVALEQSKQYYENMISNFDNYIAAIDESKKAEAGLQKQWGEDNLKIAQGLKSINDVLKKQQEELEKRNEELKKQENELIDYRIKKLEEYRDTVSEIQEQLVKILKEQYEKDKDNALNSLKEKLEADKKAIDEELKIEEERHKQQLENYEEEDKAFETLINNKIKILEDQESAQDYEKEIKNRNEEIQKIQSELNSILYDDTVATKKRREELEEDLKNKIEEKQDFIDKKSIERRKDSLKDELDKNKKSIDSLKKTEDKKYELEKERLDKKLTNIQDAYDEEVKKTEEKYKQLLKSENLYSEARVMIVDGEFDKISKLMIQYGKEFEDGSGIFANALEKNIIDKLNQVKQLMQQVHKLGSFADLDSSIDSTIADAYGDKYIEVNQGTDGKKVLEKIKDVEARQKARYDKAIASGDNSLAQKIREETERATGRAAPFKNEGYTGNWSGGQGKLALVHPEEFILNKNTVANMLQGNLLKILPQINMPKIIPNTPSSSSVVNQFQFDVNIPSNFDGSMQNVRDLAKNIKTEFLKELKQIGFKAKF